MRPAFSSTRQAAAFALLLQVVLLLPFAMQKSWLPSRQEIYNFQGWGGGPYPWLRNQIFEETNDIDIAFVGSSHIINGINPLLVQTELTKKIGRPAVVRTLAWGGPGYDGLYLIAKDLLEHRKVRLLVFYDEKVAATRNPATITLFRFSDNSSDLVGLPLPDQGLYYGSALFGMPRNLLGLVRRSLPVVLSPHPDLASENNSSRFPAHLGADAVPPAPNSPDTLQKFLAAQNPRVSVYSTNVGGDFEISRTALPVWQAHFAKKFAALCQSHDCKLVLLDIPILAEAQSPVIHERAAWPDLLQADVAMIGVPPKKLFAGLTENEIRGLFWNDFHFNRNGMEHFTSVITPALLQLYETATEP